MRRQLAGLGEVVGWKMGLTVPALQKQLGLEGPVVGHLPHNAIVEGEHSLAGGRSVALEPELALELGDGGSLTRMGLALEVVDLNRALDELEEVIAQNIFQRAVAFGPLADPVERPLARVSVNGEERHRVEAEDDPRETLAFVRDFLARFGVEVEPGQLVIAGSLTRPIPVSPGDVVELAADGLGSISLALTP